jgi:hypothetical protein
VIIDQDMIDAGGFPCSRGWWERFMPDGGWVKVTVHRDGIFVTLTPDPGREDELAAWIALFPRLACAVIPPGEAPYDVAGALALLDDTDRRITPERVAERFRDLTGTTEGASGGDTTT